MVARLRFAAFLVLFLTVSVARGQIGIDTEINALVHRDPSIRKAAAGGLAAKGIAAVDKLVQVMELKHGGACLVKAASEASTGCCTPCRFAAISHACCAECHDRNIRHVVSAGIVLARIGPPARDLATDRLVKILDNAETSDWRWNVTANVLAKLDPAWAVSNEKESVLIKGLERDGPMAQYAAVKTTGEMPKWFAQKAGTLQGKPEAIGTLESRHKRFVANASDALLVLLNTWPNPNLKKSGRFADIIIEDHIIQAGVISCERCCGDDFVILDALHAICIHGKELRAQLFERTGPRFRESTRWEAVGRLVALGNNASKAAEVRNAALQDAAIALSELIANRFGRKRLEAAELAGQLGAVGAPTVSALALALRSGDAKLRLQAATSLAASGADLRNALREKRDFNEDTLEELLDAYQKCVLPSLKDALAIEQLRGNPGQAGCDAIQQAIKATEDAVKAIDTH